MFRPFPRGRASMMAARAMAMALAVAGAACSSSSAGDPDPGGSGGRASPGGRSGGAGTPGTGGTTGAGVGGTTGGSGGARAGDAGTPTGTGLGKNGTCWPICAFPAITNPTGDGYGWEQQRTCLVAGSAAAAGTLPCTPPPPTSTRPPGNGVFDGQVCNPVCASARTDADSMGRSDGYGYEHGRNCIVAGTAAAYGGVPCVPPALPPGDGVMLTDPPPGTCAPICVNPLVSDPDGDGYGFENNLVCVASTSLPALQNAPCDAPDPPPPPTPPPPPPGTGWRSDYTATMFGQADCAPFGLSDGTNLNNSTCVGRGAVSLGGANTMFFGAAGDLSSLWNGAPTCTCNGQEVGGRCGSAPSCAGQTDCGQCVEVTCNFTGIYSFNGDGFTHNEFCKPGRSVVVQLLDACPHNHPNNTYWCTAARPQHIDLSCTAFSNITVSSTTRPLPTIGSVNVHVRPVNCNVGLGVKTF